MAEVELVDHAGSDLHAFWLCQFELGELGGWGTHMHEQHQVAWVSSGACTVVVDGVHWVATPTRAIWIPSGRPHDIHVTPGSRLHCLYAWPDKCTMSWPEPTELPVSSLVRELFFLLGAASVDTHVSGACATVMFDQLAAHPPQTRPTLVMPRDDRAVEVAQRILHDPADGRSLAEWAQAVSTSSSTLRRAFLGDTHLSFSEWRTRARLDAAAPLIEAGLSTEQVARHVGYSSRSGFVDAYRRHHGRPPAPRSEPGQPPRAGLLDQAS